MFKLSKKAIQAINTPAIRVELAHVLKCTERTIIRYISDNDKDVDTDLTKAAAMEVIRKHTGLRDDQILVRLPRLA